MHQQVEYLWLKRDRLAASPQLSARHIEHMIAKAKLHLGVPAGILDEQSHVSQGIIKRA